jgi:hypothetical protein
MALRNSILGPQRAGFAILWNENCVKADSPSSRQDGPP